MGGGSNHSRHTVRPHDNQLPRWLSVHQARQLSRCRRQTVIDAMESGELPFEQRGRNRYIRRSDFLAWEEFRLCAEYEPNPARVRADLSDLL